MAFPKVRIVLLPMAFSQYSLPQKQVRKKTVMVGVENTSKAKPCCILLGRAHASISGHFAGGQELRRRQRSVHELLDEDGRLVWAAGPIHVVQILQNIHDREAR